MNDYIAKELYNLAMDMDYMDYEDTKEESLLLIESALDWLEEKAKTDTAAQHLFWLLETITRV